MTHFSKATYNSQLNWYRVNLSKRKELNAFRNTIIAKINDINSTLFENNEESDTDSKEVFLVDNESRQYLFPSNDSNVNGYYDSIMSNIKFSCWVKCTESELTEILKKLNDDQITADASRKSNSGMIRVSDENEVNALKWIIKNAPQNIYRANSLPSDTKPATLTVPGNVVLAGELSKMRGKVDTDKFFFTVLDTNLFMVINKGTADEAVDLSEEIEAAKKAKVNDKANKERHWMVLRASHGSEKHIEDKILRWKDDAKDENLSIETYLPMYVKDVKKGGKVIGQRKALFCPGYLFIYTSINELIKIESNKFWDKTSISKYLVRESMRKKEENSAALIIRDRDMTNFKFAADSNLGNIELDAEDYVDNEPVRYYNPNSPFNQQIGRILHKKDNLYLTFLPIGLMTVTKAIKIESSEIRKLSNKEKAELKL